MSSYEDQPLPVEDLTETSIATEEKLAYWERRLLEGERKAAYARRMLGRMTVQQEVLFTMPSPMSIQAADLDKFGVNAVTRTSTAKTDKHFNPSDAFARVLDTANID
ncbi:MAG TPA: hypothetical protein VFM68_00535 [Candidatus Saccharimonadales bacterium]|nr:hypothetical protein [Candidatus Saccharimonadales bacterium]